VEDGVVFDAADIDCPKSGPGPRGPGSECPGQ
jgi:hypothetical protein